MISEVFLILAGHESSLFPEGHKLLPAFTPLLHPGEQQCLESLGKIAYRYRRIKRSCAQLSTSSSRYLCALSAALSRILKDEYESLVITTEEKVLTRDANLVGSGSFVPLSSVRAIFAPWDAPFASLASLMDELEGQTSWQPGPLIDLLITRSKTGVNRVASILSQLSIAVQHVWRTQLAAFVVHGTVSASDPLATDNYVLLEGSMPSCASPQAIDSIAYVGRAIGTVKAANWQKQLPRSLAQEHTAILEKVVPEDRHEFDAALTQIRTNVSEWLWMNVLTRRDVEEAVTSLSDYFLLLNGEFSLSLIREIERLKISRLTLKSGATNMIREQDLNLALLRASLNTTAQHDPCLSRLRFSLPEGPIRPLLPSLAAAPAQSPGAADAFVACLLGTPLQLHYQVSWPLDLFLHPTDLASYAILFSYLSSLRKTHTRIHTCWSALSNAQRARRKWTGLGEGGSEDDFKARAKLLRCGWGVVRDMAWFLDTLFGYTITDVIELELDRLKQLLGEGEQQRASQSTDSLRAMASNSAPAQLDFTSLRTIHSMYLDRLMTGCLLTNSALTAILLPIFEVCERFVAHVERWGGDILPALLFEGSVKGGGQDFGSLLRERRDAVYEMNETLHGLLDSFYEQLSQSTTQQTFTNDASKSVLLNATANMTTQNFSRMSRGHDAGLADVRRHIERLLLRLDFNGAFSDPRKRERRDANILVQGGLA